MFGSFGAQELLIILIIILVLFGAKKIPEIMRGLGQGMREFRQASSETKEGLERALEGEPETEEEPEEPAAEAQETEYQG